MRENDVGHTARSETRAQQGQGERISEQDDLRARPCDLGIQTIAERGRRPYEPASFPDNVESCPFVECLGSIRGGCDHRDLVRRQRPTERIERPLDAADPGREVVRDDEGPWDLHPPDILPEAVREACLEEGGAGTEPIREDVLERESTFAELAEWRTVSVRGRDARAWLHDLVTADVQSLADGQTRRSLLLTPTGRIRADFHVARVDGSFLLLQAPGQPQAVDGILAPYVLSSDVEMDDRSERSLIVAVLGGLDAEDGEGALVLEPSVLGSGHDVIVPRGEPARRLRAHLRRRGLAELTENDLEIRRIRRGDVRMGADFGPDALPAEAGLEGAIDLTKGCFLGQESVAKVRNLGHPRRVLRHVRSQTPVAPGAPVLTGGVAVGEVTSAAENNGGTDVIVRVRWDAALGELSTATGPLSLRREE